MSWSYNVSLVSQYGKDYLRLLIGDTVTADQQLQDEELTAMMATRGSVYGAAAECFRSLAAKFSRMVDQQAGTSKIFYSQMAKAYSSRAIYFETLATSLVTPYAGGTSVQDMQNQELNSDRVGPAFTISMDDNNLPVASVGPETTNTVGSAGRSGSGL